MPSHPPTMCHWCKFDRVERRSLPQPNDDETDVEYVPLDICTYCGGEQPVDDETDE